MKLTLRPYQQMAIKQLRTHSRYALWAEMGMGKTLIAIITAAEHILYAGGRVLVLAPKLVAGTTWPMEIEKWDSLRGLRVSQILGTDRQRRGALNTNADIYTMNYENLPWLSKNISTWPFTLVIADESTRLKGFRLGGKTGRRARALAKKLRGLDSNFIELTGTPSPNGLIDLWGQFYFLDEGRTLGRTFTAFRDRWFRPINGGGAFTRWQPMPHSNNEIIARCAPLALSLRARDWFPNLLEPIEVNVEVALPPTAQKHYKEMEKEMFTALENGADLEAKNAAMKSGKCLQITSGAVYTNPRRTEWLELHSAKLDALESIIEEAAGMPVLVAYHFRHDLARLQKRFPRGRVLDGKERTLREWNTGTIPVLFAHPDSAGHGLNLQDGGNIIVFFTSSWKLESRMQIIERIGPTRQLQAGHNRPVFIYNIVVPATVDMVVLERHKTKITVQEALMRYRRAVPCRL